jgi:hypothetical protein
MRLPLPILVLVNVQTFIERYSLISETLSNLHFECPQFYVGNISRTITYYSLVLTLTAYGPLPPMVQKHVFGNP